jgi:hypothetical protein
MNSQEILLDLLQSYKDGVDATLKDLPAEALTFQPDPEANHIAVTMWHLGRIMDMVVVMRIQNKTIDDELWFVNNWMEKTGYDPRGKGSRGLGVLIGFSVAEMLQVPVLSLDDMKKYFDETFSALVNIVKELTPEQLDEKASGGDPQRTYYEWTKICLSDGMRHTGEMLAIKSMWERTVKNSNQ